MADTYYSLQGSIIRETEKAILFQVEEINGLPIDDSPQEWFPLSQVKSILRSTNSDLDKIEVKEWILQQKELL